MLRTNFKPSLYTKVKGMLTKLNIDTKSCLLLNAYNKLFDKLSHFPINMRENKNMEGLDGNFFNVIPGLSKEEIQSKELTVPTEWVQYSLNDKNGEKRGTITLKDGLDTSDYLAKRLKEEFSTLCPPQLQSNE